MYVLNAKLDNKYYIKLNREYQYILDMIYDDEFRYLFGKAKYNDIKEIFDTKDYVYNKSLEDNFIQTINKILNIKHIHHVYELDECIYKFPKIKKMIKNMHSKYIVFRYQKDHLHNTIIINNKIKIIDNLDDDVYESDVFYIYHNYIAPKSLYIHNFSDIDINFDD